MKNKIKFCLLTGFLGAGKTTLLKNLINALIKDNIRAGIIVNEFGKVSIDGIFLSEVHTDVVELNNGSIFCKCLSGTFLDQIISFSDKPIDYLFVESTGLADPYGLSDIITEVEKRTKGQYEFVGAICVTAADTFMKLHKKLATFNRQIKFSNVILINKIDKVVEDELESIKTVIREINKDAQIICTTYSSIDLSEFNMYTEKDKSEQEKLAILSGDPDAVEGSEFNKRVETVLIRTFNDKAEPLVTAEMMRNDEEKELRIKSFIEKLSEISFRIKGFVALGEDSSLVVNCTGNEINIVKQIITPRVSYELVVIVDNDDKTLKHEIVEKWENIVGIYAEFE